MAGERTPITYASTGVNYDAMDPLKRLAQLRARETSGNIERLGFKVVEMSRGESAFVVDEGDRFSAHVIEGLGTKNIVAEMQRNQSQIAAETQKITGKTYYDSIAQDTVAMIVNDLITVGADPVLVNAYWAAGNSEWFSDKERVEDLVKGWGIACDKAGAVWGGGETPTLIDIISSNTADLAGSAYGIIKPKERLTLGDKITVGDAILLVESSGIHANGLTLARKVAKMVSDGYETKLSDEKTYGESLLSPTHIYAGLVRDLFEAGVDIHYMVNITGHGWRKLMRANRDFAYVINRIFTPQPIFKFIQEQSGNDDREMYGNFNMGAGFAIILKKEDVSKAMQLASKNDFISLRAGHIEEGEKQVVIGPKNIVFSSKSLDLR